MALNDKRPTAADIARVMRYRASRFVTRVETSISIWTTVIETITGIASVAALVCLVVYAGYDLSPKDCRIVVTIMHTSQIIFGLHILYQLTLRFRSMVRQSHVIKWIVDILIVVSLVAWAMPDMQNPWLPWLKSVILSKYFFFTAIGAYSLVDVSYAISRIPGRRTNPSLLMSLSFLFFILIGSLVLMLPRCTYSGISYIDSLFLSASAVCITGLTPVDISTTLTPLGLLSLSILVQLGSLGVITFTSFFAMFFTGNTSIYNQLLLRDIIYSKSMNSLIPTLLYVLGFTVSIEVVGAVCVYFTIPAELGLNLQDKVVFAAFHSMSSFCNAGFSCLQDGMANPALMASDQWIYIVTSVLIFAGAVGFPILVNFKEIIKNYIRRLYYRVCRVKASSGPVHIFDLNTKIVLYTTITILVVSTVLFMALEYDNTLRGMSITKKVVQSVFNSLIPRSAGFASVNPSSFLNVTILLILVQMIIGGASQSMAGGVKVNTFGVLMLNLRSILYGHQATSAFHRTISQASVRRANAVLMIAVISLTLYIMALMLLEPDTSAKSLIFEAVSAVFTVGSSLGITAELSDASKVLLSTAMFFGRVGIISILCGIIGQRRDLSSHYPTDNVIIN